MIKLTNIEKRYGYTLSGVYDITYTFNDTGLYFIEGNSGCGKTTLLNILGGIDVYNHGSYVFWGRELRDLNEQQLEYIRSNYIGYIFQDFKLFENLTVYENVAISCHNTNDAYLSDIDALLEKLDMLPFKDKLVKNLSAGQKQRTAIARALIKRPKVILADEPTGNLDSKSSKQVMDILKEISKEYLVIIVSHDHQLVLDYANYSILMKDGRIVDCYSYGSFGEQEKNEMIKVDKPKISFKNFFVENTKILKHSFEENASVCVIFFLVCILLSVIISFMSFTPAGALYTTCAKNNENYVLVNHNYNTSLNGIDTVFVNGSGYHFYEQKDKVDFYGFYKTKLIDSSKSESELATYPDVYVASYRDDYDLQLLSGHYPQNDNEIIISDLVYDSLASGANINKLQEFNYDISICGVYHNDFDSSVDNIPNEVKDIACYGAYVKNINRLNTRSSFEMGNLKERKQSKEKALPQSNITGTLLAGHNITKQHGVIINKTIYDMYFEGDFEKATQNRLYYDYYLSVDADNYSKDFSPYCEIYDMVVEGVYDDGDTSLNVYFSDDTFNYLNELKFKYFDATYTQIKTNKTNFKKLSKLNFKMLSYYSNSIYKFQVGVNVAVFIMALLFIFVTIFSVQFLQKDLDQLFKERRESIGTLLSIGVSKKELYCSITIRYILIVILLFALSLIVNIPIYLMINYMIGNAILGGLTPSIMTVNYGLAFTILVLLLAIVIWTSIKGLKKIKNNNVVYWMKNDQ